MKENKILKSALSYRNIGLSVIPCTLWFKEGVTNKAEKSSNVDWKSFQSRLASEEEIENWWREEPNAQLAIITGQVSGNIFVIDIDDGADQELVRSLQIPPTLIAKTPRGTGSHVYLRAPAGVKIKSGTSVFGENSKIDIRAEGALAIVPPSTYPDGRPYEWLTEFSLDAIVDAPPSLLEKLMNYKKREITNITLGVSEGARNDSAASYLGLMLKTVPRSMWETYCWQALVGWNLQNRPPLPESELRSVFNSITQREITQQPKENTFSPVLWGDFKQRLFDRCKWRIKDLIPAEGTTIIASPAGEKKTWLALDIARCISSGLPFAGQFETVQGGVLYIDAEMAQSELHRRGSQLNLPDNVWILTIDEINLASKSSVEWLSKFISENGISTIFIDTLRAAAGGLNEDKAEEVRKFFSVFKSVKGQGVAIVFLDHCRKPRQFEGRIPKKDQLFGSQDKAGNLEMLLMVKSDEGNDEIQLHVVKNRIAKGIDPFKIILRDTTVEQGFVHTELSYGGQVDVERVAKKEEAKELIIAAIGEHEELTTKELIEIGKEKVGSKNITAALAELRECGEVLVRKRGKANAFRLPSQQEDPIFSDSQK